MGDKPIIEASGTETIPDDGRITLGEEYAHRRVPLELNVLSDEPVEYNGRKYDEGWEFWHAKWYNCDSRGRVTIPADLRESHDEVLWFISEAAVEHGGIGEAYEELNEGVVDDE